MDRRRWRIVGLILVVVDAAGLVLVASYRKARFDRAAPAWLDPQQPPDGVAAELSTLTADQSWAANRCRHMTACCGEQSAGSRIRRTYPGTLADAPWSLVRARADLSVGGVN